MNTFSSILALSRVFTLLSIKTRIETAGCGRIALQNSEFLLYYPLKQGLKLSSNRNAPVKIALFLLYYPLKQGLKHLPQA